MRSNKGVTLLELMVVVVIIGILAGVAGLSISTISAASAKKAAAQLNSYLSTVRTKCMTRAGTPPPYALIYNEDGIVIGEYFEDGKSVGKDEITDKRVTVKYIYTVDEDSNDQVVNRTVEGDLTTSDSSKLKISFARSTGALKTLSTSDQEIEGGNSSISNPVDIIITGGNNTYTVRIIPQTGNHEIIKGGEP